LKRREIYTPLLAAVAGWNFVKARFLVENGANMHREGLNYYNSPITKTPRSFALYASWTFYKWRKIVNERSPDLQTFVEEMTVFEILKFIKTKTVPRMLFRQVHHHPSPPNSSKSLSATQSHLQSPLSALSSPFPPPPLIAFRTPLQNLQACVYLGITRNQLLDPVIGNEPLLNPLSISIFSSLSQTCASVGHSRFRNRSMQAYTSR